MALYDYIDVSLVTDKKIRSQEGPVCVILKGLARTGTQEMFVWYLLLLSSLFFFFF